MRHVLTAFAAAAALVAGIGAASAQPGAAGVVPMAVTAKTAESNFLGPDELRPEQTSAGPPWARITDATSPPAGRH
jgi:hypothetical protein